MKGETMGMRWKNGLMRFLVSLLALTLVWGSLGALTEAGEAITLEVRTGNWPVYAADDPFVTSLRDELAPAAATEPVGTEEPAEEPKEEDELPVLVLPVKKSLGLQITVRPAATRNKKVVLSVDDEELVRVQGKNLTGLKPGETVLTIASEADPSATATYRVLVIQQVSRVSLTAAEKTVAVGGTVALTPGFVPEDTTLQQVTWASANEQIATVDADGIVTGLKRGGVRITATAADGSKVRASLNVQVVQLAEVIELKETEGTVDVGGTLMLHATVLPRDTNDKSVVWFSSDENIAKVNAQGRVTGVSLGECEITCASKTAEGTAAKALIHVQQPVTRVTFDDAPVVYVNETGKLTWNIEPANASNPAVKLTSSSEKILTVSDDGTVTGVKAGEAWVNAITTDGSNRRARVKVRVLQHLTGVRMRRNTAYIDIGQTSTTGAILEPSKLVNPRMTWECDDPLIASIEPLKNEPNRLKITGLREGETLVTGTTEDGGLQTSLRVLIGNWDYALTLKDAYVQGADVYMTVRNDSLLDITSITAEVSVFDINGDPVPANSQDGTNTFHVVYRKTLQPGASTREENWKYVDFMLPDSLIVSEYVVKITEYQIENDWIKLIQKKHQPTKICPVHL